MTRKKNKSKATLNGCASNVKVNFDRVATSDVPQQPTQHHWKDDIIQQYKAERDTAGKCYLAASLERYLFLLQLENVRKDVAAREELRNVSAQLMFSEEEKAYLAEQIEHEIQQNHALRERQQTTAAERYVKALKSFNAGHSIESLPKIDPSVGCDYFMGLVREGTITPPPSLVVPEEDKLNLSFASSIASEESGLGTARSGLVELPCSELLRGDPPLSLAEPSDRGMMSAEEVADLDGEESCVKVSQQLETKEVCEVLESSLQVDSGPSSGEVGNSSMDVGTVQQFPSSQKKRETGEAGSQFAAVEVEPTEVKYAALEESSGEVDETEKLLVTDKVEPSMSAADTGKDLAVKENAKPSVPAAKKTKALIPAEEKMSVYSPNEEEKVKPSPSPKEIISSPLVEEEGIPSSLAEEKVIPSPLAEGKVMHFPLAEEKVIDSPLAEEKVMHSPLAEEKVMHSPLVEEEVVHSPLVEEEVVHSPLVEEKVVHSPLVEEKVVHSPLVEEKVMHSPLAEEKVMHSPLAEEKVIPSLLAKEKVMDSPLVEEKVIPSLLTKEKVIPSPLAAKKVMHSPLAEEKEKPSPAPLSNVEHHYQGRMSAREAVDLDGEEGCVKVSKQMAVENTLVTPGSSLQVDLGSSTVEVADSSMDVGALQQALGSRKKRKKRKKIGTESQSAEVKVEVTSAKVKCKALKESAGEVDEIKQPGSLLVKADEKKPAAQSNRVLLKMEPPMDNERLSVLTDKKVEPSTPAEGKVKPFAPAEGKVKPSAPAEGKVKPAPAEQKVNPFAPAERKVKPAVPAEQKVKPAALAKRKEKLSAQGEEKVKPSTQAERKVKPAQAEGKVKPSTQAEWKVKPSAQTEGKVKPSAAEWKVKPSAQAEGKVKPAAPTELKVKPSAQAELKVKPAAPVEKKIKSSAPAKGKMKPAPAEGEGKSNGKAAVKMKFCPPSEKKRGSFSEDLAPGEHVNSQDDVGEQIEDDEQFARALCQRQSADGPGKSKKLSKRVISKTASVPTSNSAAGNFHVTNGDRMLTNTITAPSAKSSEQIRNSRALSSPSPSAGRTFPTSFNGWELVIEPEATEPSGHSQNGFDHWSAPYDLSHNEFDDWSVSYGEGQNGLDDWSAPYDHSQNGLDDWSAPYEQGRYKPDTEWPALTKSHTVKSVHAKSQAATAGHSEPCDNQYCQDRRQFYLRKTTICRQWQAGRCKHNLKDCKFAHGPTDRKRLPKHEMCEKHKKGKCQWESQCVYAHSAAEYRPLKNGTVHENGIIPPHNPSPTDEDHTGNDSDDCAICLCEFTPEMGRCRLDCGHDVFHKKCIQSWVERGKSCPICRENIQTTDSFVIPRKSRPRRQPVLSSQ